MVDAALASGVDGLVVVLLGAGCAPSAFPSPPPLRPPRECRSSRACAPPGRILRATYAFEGADATCATPA